MKNFAAAVLLMSSFVSAHAATLVVLNKSEHSAMLIDPDAGKVLAKRDVGLDPDGIGYGR